MQKTGGDRSQSVLEGKTEIPRSRISEAQVRDKAPTRAVKCPGEPNESNPYFFCYHRGKICEDWAGCLAEGSSSNSLEAAPRDTSKQQGRATTLN